MAGYDAFMAQTISHHRILEKRDSDLYNTASLCTLTALCEEISGNDISIKSMPENSLFGLRLYIGDRAKLFACTTWRLKRDVCRINQSENEEALAKP